MAFNQISVSPTAGRSPRRVTSRHAASRSWTARHGPVLSLNGTLHARNELATRTEAFHERSVCRDVESSGVTSANVHKGTRLGL